MTDGTSNRWKTSDWMDRPDQQPTEDQRLDGPTGQATDGRPATGWTDGPSNRRKTGDWTTDGTSNRWKTSDWMDRRDQQLTEDQRLIRTRDCRDPATNVTS